MKPLKQYRQIKPVIFVAVTLLVTLYSSVAWSESNPQKKTVYGESQTVGLSGDEDSTMVPKYSRGSQASSKPSASRVAPRPVARPSYTPPRVSRPVNQPRYNAPRTSRPPTQPSRTTVRTQPTRRTVPTSVRTPPNRTPPTSVVRTPPTRTPPTRTPPTSVVRTPPTSVVRTPPNRYSSYFSCKDTANTNSCYSSTRSVGWSNPPSTRPFSSSSRP